MTYAAVVAAVLAEYGHIDVEPLVLADLMGAARYGTTTDVAALLDRHGFTTEGHAGELASEITEAVRRAAT